MRLSIMEALRKAAKDADMSLDADSKAIIEKGEKAIDFMAKDNEATVARLLKEGRADEANRVTIEYGKSVAEVRQIQNLFKK